MRSIPSLSSRLAARLTAPALSTVAFLALASAALAGCGDGSSCVDGMTISCACPGGATGVQTCRGGRYEACQCGGPDVDAGVADAAVPPMPDADIDGGGLPFPDAGTDAAMSLFPDADIDGGGMDFPDAPIDAYVATPDAFMACAEGTTRCGAAGVERCTGGLFVADTSCALTCSMGECVDVPAMCTPGAVRCYRSAVQRCNREGTAWLFDSVCREGCAAGLCTGACTPGEARCNGSSRELCAPSGASWTSAERCTMGCEDRVCVEAELSLPGTVLDLSGTHVYAGCVDLDLGGELRVPAGQALSIRARCLRVAASARITLGAGSSLSIRVNETADVAGTVSGGTRVFLESLGTLRLGGSASSATTILRADDLGILASGRTAGTTLNAALYGSAFSNAGMHSGVVSVMPPTPIESPTHPSGTTWNLAGDEVVVTWNRPFASVRGYYVATGEVTPGPATGTLRTTESIAIPIEDFGPGDNRVRIVSVNADSEIGTHFEELVVRLNVASPSVGSSSHPNELAWGGADDVFLSWSDPPGEPAGTFTGYLYAWDHEADTVPDAATGTFDDRRMLLLSDQAPGIWYFHIVVLDNLGRPSPTTAHYQVRIGAEPGYGNVAGTVTDMATGMPIDRASVLVSGGLLRTRSGATGDYTFRGAVPASSRPYRITARARGYEATEAMVTVGTGGAVVQHFMMRPSASPPGPAIDLGWETRIASVTPNSPEVAMGPSGRFLWTRTSSVASDDQMQIVRTTGEVVRNEPTLEEYYSYPRSEVGWNGTELYAIDYYKCGYDAAFSPGHGWSCLQMRTWDASGTVTAGWRRWRNSGQTGSPSAVWNGSSWGTFFISYSALYFRELNDDLTFTNGLDATTHTTLSMGHYDTRQSATTRAIWDGTGYAVAWQIGRTAADGTPYVYFARWGRDLSVLQARLEVDDTRSSSEIDLVFDGSQYHLAYVDRNGSRYDVVLRTVSSTGTLGARTVVHSSMDSSTRSPSLAFDGANLLLAWEGASSGSSHLEVRDPSDHTILESYDVAGSQPRVDVNATTGEGVLLHTRGGATYVVPFVVN
jgi:hypothetical protein